MKQEFLDSGHQTSQTVPVKRISERWETNKLSPVNAPRYFYVESKGEWKPKQSPEVFLLGVWGGQGTSGSRSSTERAPEDHRGGRESLGLSTVLLSVRERILPEAGERNTQQNQKQPPRSPRARNSSYSQRHEWNNLTTYQQRTQKNPAAQVGKKSVLHQSLLWSHLTKLQGSLKRIKLKTL